MSAPPEIHIEWARRFRELVPGDVQVMKHVDESGSHSIAIATSRQPAGVVAATVGLMDVDQSKNPDVVLRSEVLMNARGDEPKIGNVLATVGFFIMNDGWRISPGTVFEDLVAWYLPDTQLPHLYFLPPFQWDGDMNRIDLSDGPIYPLLALPISDAERIMAKEQGGEALENLWEQADMDVLSWGRASVI